MICPNCGVEYEDRMEKCPYCDSENIAEAKRRMNNLLKQYEKEEKEIRKDFEEYPNRQVRKYTGRILGVLAVLAVLCGLLTVGYFLWGYLRAAVEGSASSRHERALESCFQQGKYDEMTEYMEKHHLAGIRYAKYGQIKDALFYLDWMDTSKELLESCVQLEFTGPKKREEEIRTQAASYLEKASHVLADTSEQANDTVFLGNEEVLMQLHEICVQRLKEDGFTEDEIQILEQGRNTQDFDEVVESFAGRLL